MEKDLRGEGRGGEGPTRGLGPAPALHTGRFFGRKAECGEARLPPWREEQRGALPPSRPRQARAQGSSAAGPVPSTLPDLGIGFYTTDFIAFLYNSRLSELERPWRLTSIRLHPFHGEVKGSPETELSRSQLGTGQTLGENTSSSVSLHYMTLPPDLW